MFLFHLILSLTLVLVLFTSPVLAEELFHQSSLPFTVMTVSKKLPRGFIAVAPKEMNWSAAKAFCAKQGGRLPQIGVKGKLVQSWPGNNRNQISTVEGFRDYGDWPEIPISNAWLGTEVSNNSGHSWVILMGNGGLDEDDNVPRWSSLYTVPQNERYGVICVR